MNSGRWLRTDIQQVHKQAGQREHIIHIQTHKSRVSVSYYVGVIRLFNKRDMNPTAPLGC